MKLYFSPLACSLATRIALVHAGAEATFVEVDPKTKTTSTGADYATIHGLGLVPALDLGDGCLLVENAAVLQWVADAHPAAMLAPADPLGRARLHQWLCFIGTELHKGTFAPLLDPEAPEGAKAYALAKGRSRLAWLETQLSGRELLLDRFSVADAYLFAVLNWTFVTPVDLASYPALRAYHRRVAEMPSVRRAFDEERRLYAQRVTAPLPKDVEKVLPPS